jgi:hypothetical protein
MEIEGALLEKMQRSLTRICEDCHNVTGESLYRQLTGKAIACKTCKQRNLLLYLPIKLIIQKMGERFGLTEQELIARTKEDKAIARLVETISKRIRESSDPIEAFKTGYPLVLELDLDAPGSLPDSAGWGAMLRKQKAAGTVGVRFRKKGLLSKQEFDVINQTREDGFMVSLITTHPFECDMEHLKDQLDHIELRFTSPKEVDGFDPSQQKYNRNPNTTLSIVLTISPVAQNTLLKSVQIAQRLSATSLIVEPPTGGVGCLDDCLGMIKAGVQGAFLSVRDPVFIQRLATEYRHNATFTEPPVLILMKDLDTWHPPVKGLLTPDNIFSLVPIHIGSGMEMLVVRADRSGKII